MTSENFAPENMVAFILTNRRPDRVITYENLRKSGYTGPIRLIVDSLDPEKDNYIKKYGDEVCVFDKPAYAGTFDVGDNFDGLRGVIYARNAAFDIAEALGFKYFIALDDDYTSFQYRFDNRLDFNYKAIKNLDRVWSQMLDFYIKSGATSLAMAQGGDFIGGSEGTYAQQVQLLRKCMNSFFCSTDRRFDFIGRINEDVNAYTQHASVGKLFFTTNQVALVQTTTQKNDGGMTVLYLDVGTYVKSFYSVMYQPASVKIAVLTGGAGARLHHQVTWKNQAPMILRESVKEVRLISRNPC